MKVTMIVNYKRCWWDGKYYYEAALKTELTPEEKQLNLDYMYPDSYYRPAFAVRRRVLPVRWFPQRVQFAQSGFDGMEYENVMRFKTADQVEAMKVVLDAFIRSYENEVAMIWGVLHRQETGIETLDCADALEGPVTHQLVINRDTGTVTRVNLPSSKEERKTESKAEHKPARPLRL